VTAEYRQPGYRAWQRQKEETDIMLLKKMARHKAGWTNHVLSRERL
jgi:hypothetical protein